MNTPSYPYGTIVLYTNMDGSLEEIVAEHTPAGVCTGCIFNQTFNCTRAPECGSLIWKEAVK